VRLQGDARRLLAVAQRRIENSDPASGHEHVLLNLAARAGDAPVVWLGRRLRLSTRRVFVCLPLVGENEDDDEKNERTRAGKPHERLHGDA
jgi:hypothetical protein